MMINRNFIILILFIAVRSLAQTSADIETSRPTQSIGSHVVGTQVFQIESGVGRARALSNTSVETDLATNTLRYGTNEKFEFDALVNFQKESTESSGIRSQKNGLSDLQLGFTTSLNEKSDGLIPGIALQTLFKTTFVSQQYRSDQLAPILIMAFMYDFKNDLIFTNNLGIAYDGFVAIPNYNFISCISFPIQSAGSGFLEFSQNIKNDYGTSLIDGGVVYLVNSNFQLDVSGGWGNSQGISNSFVNFGFSWRKLPARTAASN
jgi:hypothetical protein